MSSRRLVFTFLGVFAASACTQGDKLDTAPTIIVSNSNAVGGSGTYPGFACPKNEESTESTVDGSDPDADDGAWHLVVLVVA